MQDLEGKIIVDELRQEVISTNSKAEPPQCTCLAWSADGQVQLRSIASVHVWLSTSWFIVCPSDYTHSLSALMSSDDSPANMRGTHINVMTVRL